MKTSSSILQLLLLFFSGVPQSQAKVPRSVKDRLCGQSRNENHICDNGKVCAPRKDLTTGDSMVCRRASKVLGPCAGLCRHTGDWCPDGNICEETGSLEEGTLVRRCKTPGFDHDEDAVYDYTDEDAACQLNEDFQRPCAPGKVCAPPPKTDGNPRPNETDLVCRELSSGVLDDCAEHCYSGGDWCPDGKICKKVNVTVSPLNTTQKNECIHPPPPGIHVENCTGAYFQPIHLGVAACTGNMTVKCTEHTECECGQLCGVRGCEQKCMKACDSPCTNVHPTFVCVRLEFLDRHGNFESDQVFCAEPDHIPVG